VKGESGCSYRRPDDGVGSSGDDVYRTTDRGPRSGLVVCEIGLVEGRRLERGRGRGLDEDWDLDVDFEIQASPSRPIQS
jgi:hypothetical protein